MDFINISSYYCGQMDGKKEPKKGRFVLDHGLRKCGPWCYGGRRCSWPRQQEWKVTDFIMPAVRRLKETELK